MIVNYGLVHRQLDRITAIGVDEIQYGKGHQYLTLVYQINTDVRRLLFVRRARRAKTLLRFFRDFGRQRCAKLKFVCSDMWKPYLKVIAKKALQALNILARFHIVQKLGKALDKIRAVETLSVAFKKFSAIFSRLISDFVLSLTLPSFCFASAIQTVGKGQWLAGAPVAQRPWFDCFFGPTGPTHLRGLGNFFRKMLRGPFFCANLYADREIEVQIWTPASFENSFKNANGSSAICSEC